MNKDKNDIVDSTPPIQKSNKFNKSNKSKRKNDFTKNNKIKHSKSSKSSSKNSFLGTCFKGCLSLFKSLYIIVGLIFGFPAIISFVIGCIYFNASCSMPINIWCLLNSLCLIIQCTVILLHVYFLKKNKLSFAVLTVIEIVFTSLFTVSGIPLMALEKVCVVWEEFGFGLHFIVIPLICINFLSIFLQGTIFGFIFGIQMALEQLNKKGFKEIDKLYKNDESNQVEIESNSQSDHESNPPSNSISNNNTSNHFNQLNTQEHNEVNKSTFQDSFVIGNLPFGSRLNMDTSSEEDDELITYPIDDIILSDQETDEQLEIKHHSNDFKLSKVFQRLEKRNWKSISYRDEKTNLL